MTSRTGVSDEPAVAAGRDVVRKGHVATLELAALTLWMLGCLSGFTDALDLHPADEVWYEQIGYALAHGDATALSAASCPITAFLYAVVFLLPLADWWPADVAFVVLYIGSGIACWYAFRRLLPGAALAIALVWSATEPVLQWSGGLRLPSVYVLGATLMFVAVGLFSRRHYVAGFVVLVVASTNRPELTPWLVAISLGLVSMRGLGRRRVALAAMGISLGLLAFQVSSASIRARSWMTFKQHYAGALAIQANSETARDAFRQPDDVIRTSFADSASLMDAVATAPDRVLAHVGRNLATLPRGLGDLFGSALGFAPAVSMAAYLGIALWLIVGLVLGGREGRTRVLEGMRGVPRTVWIVVATAPSALIAMLLAAPRPELLFPLVPGVALCIGMLARAMPLSDRMRNRARLALPLGVLIGTAFTGGPFAAETGRRLVNREALHLCRTHLPENGARLLAEYGAGLAFLASRDRRVLGWNPDVGVDLATLLRTHDPTHLVFAPRAEWLGTVPRVGLAEVMDLPSGSLGPEFVSPGGVVLIELGGDADRGTDRRRPSLEFVADRPTARGQRRLEFVASGMPTGSSVALQLARYGETRRLETLTEAIADPQRGAHLEFDLSDAHVGTAVSVRAYALLPGGGLFVSPCIDLVIGG